MKKRWFAILWLFALLLGTPARAESAVASSSPPADPGAHLTQALQEALGGITPDMDALFLEVEIRVGPVFLGSGTLSLKKNEFAFLHLQSRQSSCHYLYRQGIGICHLRSGETTIAFKTSDGNKIPVPTVRIAKDDGQGFRLDLQMELASNTASVPVNIGVHPDAPAYLSEKISKKYPRLIASGSEEWYMASNNATPSLILRYEQNRIAGCSVWFDREKGPPLELHVRRILVSSPIPEPDTKWLEQQARAPINSLELVYQFISRFSQLIMEFVPREGE